MYVAAAPAHFSETILYHGRCDHPSRGRVHVLGYQNVAANHASGPNAMLLHLPGVGMTRDCFVDYEGQIDTTTLAPGENAKGLVCAKGRFTPKVVAMANELLAEAARAEVS